jgi:hypothetical protein
MAGSIVKERKTANAPALTIGGRFGKYKDEEEKSSRKADVQESRAVKQMKDAWRAFRYDDRNTGAWGDWRYDEGWYFDTPQYRIHEDLLQIISKFRYIARDVFGFSLALVEFQDEDNFSAKAGIFLSALIDNGNDSDYVIHTKHLSVLPHFLGHYNEKNIIVNGDVGDSVGRWMEGGSITVNGDAGDYVGSRMQGGSIAVDGNARYGIGLRMAGGSLTVRGNVGYMVGHYMGDGEIRLEGDYVSLSANFTSGRIYHKGKLVKGK